MSTFGDFLNTPGIDRLDRELLLGFVTGTSREYIAAHPSTSLSKHATTRLEKLFDRRKNHEPLAYLTGTKEFFGNIFFVSRSTLIPRPETEHLVEKVIEKIKKLSHQKKIAVIDVGTGSGAIIVSLALALEKFSNLDFFAIDRSKRALVMAKRNAHRHHANHIHFFSGNLLLPCIKQLVRYDSMVLVANLPYLSASLYHNSIPDVQQYEPRSALESGSDGLNHYRKLFHQIKAFLPSLEIHFFLEISPEQASKLSFLPRRCEIYPDYTGRARVVTGALN